MSRGGGRGRLCLPDAPARPERGCGRSRGEGQSLCHSCRWLVSSPPVSIPPPRAAPAAESGARSLPGPPRQLQPHLAAPHPPGWGTPTRIPRGAAHATDTLPCLRRGWGGVLLFSPEPPSRGIPALHRQGVRMPLAKDHVESGAMLGKNKAGGSVWKPLSSHGPRRAGVSPSFRTAARRRGVRLRPARTNLSGF